VQSRGQFGELWKLFGAPHPQDGGDYAVWGHWRLRDLSNVWGGIPK